MQNRIMKYLKYGLIGLIIIFLLINIIRWIVAINKDNDNSHKAINAYSDTVRSQASIIDSQSYVLSNATKRIDTAWFYRKAHIDTAWVFGSKADSLVSLAALDTITSEKCMHIALALDERTSECKQLKIALSIDSNVIRSIRDTIDRVRFKLDTASKIIRISADSITKFNNSQHCKILFFPCPTRISALLIGVGSGLLLKGAIK